MSRLISDRILDLIDAEMTRQNEKFGPDRNQPPSDWMCILSEETGEVAREICDGKFKAENMDLDKYVDELIQVIAVAVQMLNNVPKYSPDYVAPTKKPALLQELRVKVSRFEIVKRTIGTDRDQYLRDRISGEVDRWCKQNNAELVKFDLEHNFFDQLDNNYIFDLIISYTEKDDA